jgi:hypothetical protein
LIVRHEETAKIRGQVNTAKLLAENPMLMADDLRPAASIAALVDKRVQQPIDRLVVQSP